MDYLHVYIEVSGLRLEVVGNYWPGEAASWDSPGEPESVEIDEVLTAEGTDIGSLIADNSDLQARVEELALEAHKEGRIWQATEAAISRREMAMEEA